MTETSDRVQHLEILRQTIDEATGYWAADTLRAAIGEALGVPPPPGDPGEIGHYAHQFEAASGDAAGESDQAGRYAREALPDAWLGMTAVSAVQGMSALGTSLERAGDVFGRAGRALRTLSSELT